MEQVKVYFAAKLRDAQEILAIREENAEWLRLSCRWPWIVGRVDDSPREAATFWQDDMDDVAACDYLIVLPDDALRGALVEVGAALALGKKVIIIGYCAAYGTWMHHPAVIKAPTIQYALNFIKPATSAEWHPV